MRTSSPRLASHLLLISTLLALPACGGPASADGDDPTLATDADGDGLSDDLENSIGTNPFDPDSDGDRLDDGTEYEGTTNPLLPDSDGDQLRDDLELDLGSAADQADAIAVLTGSVELPDGSPAAGLTVNLVCDQLDLEHAALTTGTDTAGNFGPAIPWPVAYATSAALIVRGLAGGTNYYARVPLPPLTSGTFLLPKITVAEQPLNTGQEFFIAVPHRYGDQGLVIGVMNASANPATYQWQISGAPSGEPNTQGSGSIPPWGAESFAVSPSLVTTQPANLYGNRMSIGTGGITLTAQAPIHVAVHTLGTNGADGMIAYSVPPISAYGTTYVLQTCNSYYDSAYAHAIAGDGSSELDLLVGDTTELILNNTNQTLQVGVPALVNVQNQRSLLYAGFDSIRGSKLTGSQPFGMLAGSNQVSASVVGTSGPAMEALAPVSQWATEYVTFAGIGDGQSCVHVMASDAGADVYVDGNLEVTLGQREQTRIYIPFGAGSRITSSEPVLAWQMFGWLYNRTAAIQLAPPARWRANEVVWSFTASGMFPRLAIIAPTALVGQIQITPAPMSAPTMTPTGAGETVLVYEVAEGAHRISAPGPVFPMAFGEVDGNSAGAYAYSPVW